MSAAAPHNSPDLLSTCPFCGYALEGLPIEHRCPECGNAVDRRWRVFGGVRSRSAAVNGLRIGLVVVLALFWIFLLTWAATERITPPIWLVLSAAFFTLFSWWFLGRVPRGFIALTDESVLLVSRRHAIDAIRWTDLLLVFDFTNAGWLEFITLNGTRTYSTDEAFAFDFSSQHKCVKEINDRVANLTSRRIDPADARRLVTTNSLLDRCPRCGTACATTADTFFCQTCRMEVDRRWRLFNPVQRGWAELLRNPSLFTFSLAIIGPVISCPNLRTNSLSVRALIALAWIAAVWGIGLFWSLRRRRSFAAVGPDGAALCPKTGDPRLFGWDELDELKLASGITQVIVRLADGERKFGYDGQDAAAWMAFVFTANRYLALRRAHREITKA